MKVAITGHTKGIGLSLYNVFSNNNYSTIGFSRSTGYDIASIDDRKKIISSSRECEIFINNAYHKTGQLEMLEEILNEWKNDSKYLINISSQIVSYNCKLPLEVEEYRKSKIELNSFIQTYSGPVKILNIFPGLVYTEFYLSKKFLLDMSSGMKPEDLANLIFDVHKYRKSLKVKELVVG